MQPEVSLRQFPHELRVAAHVDPIVAHSLARLARHGVALWPLAYAALDMTELRAADRAPERYSNIGFGRMIYRHDAVMYCDSSSAVKV
jgi:hypothetical protein